MKKSIFLLIVIFVIPAFAQQDRFIIGAEHVSSFHEFWDPDSIPHSRAYWDTVQSLGLNFVGLKYFQQFPASGHPAYGNASLNQIRADLDSAQRRNLGVYLTNGFDRDAKGNAYYPKRWVYQVENIGTGKVDFLNISGQSLSGSDATTHWDLAPPSGGTINFLRLLPGTTPYGIVANNLREQNLQPDYLNYYLKVRMRLPFATSFPDTNVVKVSLGDTTFGITIKAGDFGDNNWKEIAVASYYKAPIGPQPFGSTVPDSNLYNLTDKIGTVQLQNHAVKQAIPKTPYDIRIVWYNPASSNFTVDIDYVAIDDETAQSLYGGQFDARVNDFAINYQSYDAVKNLVVWDEPYVENLFPVQRYKSILAGAGSTKEPLTYWSCPPRVDSDTKRFLYESSMPILMSDVYPIPYYYAGTTTPFVTPGGTNYTDSLQLKLQYPFIYLLTDLISNAQRFSKPFWLSVQACNWALPGEMTLREPSAYEIRAMVNLGVCYGARGINYYMYTNNSSSGENRIGLLQDNSGSSTPRYLDAYGYPKWQTVKELNRKLAAIGSELLLLTWQGAKSWNNGDTHGIWNSFILAVDAKSGSVSDNPDYIETGHFKNASNADYIFVVNRRTLSSDTRDILLSLKDTTTEWKVFIVGTTDTTITSDHGVLTKSLAPGEGKLIKILQQGPSVPQNVSVSGYGGDRLHPAHPKVSWSKNNPSSPRQPISGYEIYQSTQQSSTGSLLTTVSASDSFYIDNSVNVGIGGLTIYYRVKAKDITPLRSAYSAQVGIGSSNWQEKKKATPVAANPTEFAFKPNYPNPFNPATTIAYDLPEDVFVTMKIYNEIGQEVQSLVNEQKSAGRYSVEWNASSLPSGI